jgi:hypothetical protein
LTLARPGAELGSVIRHLERFAGLEVVQWESGAALVEPGSHAYRIAVEYEPEEPWLDLFDGFLSLPGVEKVKAFIVGNWGEVASGDTPEPIVEALVGARTRLAALEALFVADLESEESEISWINQGDLSPLLSAYPALRELGIRGGTGLSLGRIQHARLEKLVIESGGLDRGVVQQIMTAELPSLTHLELWLGDDGYGANTSPEDLAPVLSGSHLPKLSWLGLRNCHYADDLAKAVAASRVLERISTLDLSLGTLGDEGAAALLAAPSLPRLKKLDLHHHYISKELSQKLQALPLEVNVDGAEQSDRDGDESHRYVAVGE